MERGFQVLITRIAIAAILMLLLTVCFVGGDVSIPADSTPVLTAEKLLNGEEVSMEEFSRMQEFFREGGLFYEAIRDRLREKGFNEAEIYSVLDPKVRVRRNPPPSGRVGR